MQQRTRRFAAVLGGGFLTTVGLAVAACSTDNGTTPTPGLDSGGRDSSKSDSSDTPDDDGGGAKDAGKNCENAPKVQSSTGQYCFGGGPDGGKCGSGQVCCSDARVDGGFAKSSCEDAEEDPGGGYKTGSCDFTGMDGGEEWHCTQKSHCPGAGEYCCAIKDEVSGKTPGTPVENKDFEGCGAYYTGPNFVGGTRCRPDACQAGEVTLCASDSDCKSGKCVPIEIGNRFTGYCRISGN